MCDLALSDSQLLDAYIRIGVAVVHLTRLSVDSYFSDPTGTKDTDLILRRGKLIWGDKSVGTYGVELTHRDWETMALMASAESR